MKKILIFALVLLFSSCSVLKNKSKIKIDSTVQEDNFVETEIIEKIVVTNDTAVFTDEETVEKFEEIEVEDVIHRLPQDSVYKISVEGDKVSAEVVIQDGTIKLKATAKSQKVNVPQTKTIERKIHKTEESDKFSQVKEENKTKVIEKEPFSIPWWIWLILVLIIISLLFLKFKDKIL